MTPARPSTLAPRFERLREVLPAELRGAERFVLWRWELRDGKWTKPPYQPDGRLASADDPTTWSTFEVVVVAYKRGGFAGVGIVLNGDDLVGADFDHCVNGQKFDEWALPIVKGLDSYSELSPTGTGIRVLAYGKLPPGGRSKTRDGHKVEVYEAARFLTLTGHDLDGFASCIEERTERLSKFHAWWFGEIKAEQPPPNGQSAGNHADDDELLNRARSAKNGAEFRNLFDHGDAGGYGGDQSAADMALACHLAFWTNRDPSRTDQLFRRSALMRPKWDERHYADGRTYGQETISRAIELVQEGWEPGGKILPVGRPAAEPGPAPKSPIIPQPTIEVLSARQICELPDPPEADLFIGSLVVRRQRLVLGAHTGHGKTSLVGQLIKTAVEGGDFLGWTCTGGLRALVIDAEQGLRSIKRQLRAWGLDSSDQVDYIRVPDGLSLDRDPGEVAAIDAILAAGTYDIVSADPLYKLHRGDSNDERAATDLMRILDQWRETYGFANILQAHCRKPPLGTRFSMHEFFGSSAYLRGAEVVVGLQFVRQGYSRLHFFKDRDGDLPVGTNRGLLFDRETGFRPDPADGKAKESTVDAVRRLLQNEPGLTIEQLIHATGRADRTVRNALRDLGAAEEHGERNAKQWSLPLEDEEE